MKIRHVYYRNIKGQANDNNFITCAISKNLQINYKYIARINIELNNIKNGELIIEDNFILGEVVRLFDRQYKSLNFDKKLIIVVLVIRDLYYINYDFLRCEPFTYDLKVEKISISDLVIKEIIE